MSVLEPKVISQIEELMKLVSKYQIASLSVGDISISKQIHSFDSPAPAQEPAEELDEDLISWSAG